MSDVTAASVFLVPLRIDNRRKHLTTTVLKIFSLRKYKWEIYLSIRKEPEE